MSRVSLSHIVEIGLNATDYYFLHVSSKINISLLFVCGSVLSVTAGAPLWVTYAFVVGWWVAMLACVPPYSFP